MGGDATPEGEDILDGSTPDADLQVEKAADTEDADD